MGFDSYKLEVRAFGHILLGFGTFCCVLMWFWLNRNKRVAEGSPIRELTERGFRFERIWSLTLLFQIIQCICSITFLQTEFEEGKETNLVRGFQFVAIVVLTGISILSLSFSIEMFSIRHRDMARQIFRYILPIITLILSAVAIAATFVISFDGGEVVAFLYLFVFKFGFSASFIYFTRELNRSGLFAVNSKINAFPVITTTVLEFWSSISQIIIGLLAKEHGWLLGLGVLLHYLVITSGFKHCLAVPLLALIKLDDGASIDTFKITGKESSAADNNNNKNKNKNKNNKESVASDVSSSTATATATGTGTTTTGTTNKADEEEKEEKKVFEISTVQETNSDLSGKMMELYNSPNRVEWNEKSVKARLARMFIPLKFITQEKSGYGSVQRNSIMDDAADAVATDHDTDLDEDGKEETGVDEDRAGKARTKNQKGKEKGKGKKIELETVVLIRPEAFRMWYYVLFMFLVLLGYIVSTNFSDTFSEDENPVILLFGNNNLCIYFDFPPFTYFSAFLYGMIMTTLLIFEVFDIIRVYDCYYEDHVFGQGFLIFYASCTIYECLTIFFFMQIFATQPTDNIYVHVMPFILIIVALWTLALKRYLYFHVARDANKSIGYKNKWVDFLGKLYVVGLGVTIAIKIPFMFINLWGGYLWKKPGYEWTPHLTGFVDKLFTVLVIVVPVFIYYFLGHKVRSLVIKVNRTF